MDYSNIDDLSIKDLKSLADTLNIGYRRSAKDLIKDIRNKKHELYKIGKQIGNEGKDAKVYEVIVNGNKYALKQYKKSKSSSKIRKEADMQIKLSKRGISPDVIDVDLERKYIIMKKLTGHLFTDEAGTIIKKKHQEQLYRIYNIMDDEKIFHSDVNPLNYMLKNDKVYVIDFGMSIVINNSLIKKLNTDTPNTDIMTLGITLKMKSLNYDPYSYKYLQT